MPLETLARINPSQLGWAAATQWEFLVCQYCTPFQEVSFFELDAQGNGHWSPYNDATHQANTVDPESAWEAFDLVIAEQRPAIERSDQFLPEDYSQVGGFPHWVQDCYYPNCPKCKQPMQFTAQLATDEFSSGVEGTFYTYICANCSITASHYQQT